jgi:hypothetical protein
LVQLAVKAIIAWGDSSCVLVKNTNTGGAEDSSYALQIETDRLKSGLYILIVRAGTEVRTLKLIKL